MRRHRKYRIVWRWLRNVLRMRPIELSMPGRSEVRRIYVSRKNPEDVVIATDILRQRFDFVVGQQGRAYHGGESEGVMIFDVFVPRKNLAVLTRTALTIRNRTGGSVWVDSPKGAE